MRTKPDQIGHFDEDLPEPEVLSEKQWNTISCLLACESLQAAADSAGINVRTLRRWLRTPVFLEEYNRTRRQHLDHVGTHLIGGQGAIPNAQPLTGTSNALSGPHAP